MAKLYFRYGAMGSSKSANILMVRYNYEERGQYAVLLKPRTDNRDGEDEIKSRIGLSAPAEYVDDFLQEISKCWNVETSEYIYHEKRVAAVLVDEAQFLSPEEVDRLSDIVDFGSLLWASHRLFEPSLSGLQAAYGDCRRDRRSPYRMLVWKKSTVQHQIC